MGIEVFLGEPPQHIKDWIINNSQTANPKTKITFADGTSQEYDWSGKINYKTMKDAGLAENNAWIKQPQTVEIGTNVTSIGDSAFKKCSSLTSVTIPDSVTSIGDYAFEDCSSLTSVTIGNGVTSIGDYAFIDCSSLTSVTIGNGVTSIGAMAFMSCSSLTNVTIPDSVTKIDTEAFKWCSGLTSVTIGNGVTNIGYRVFTGCINLTSVTFSGKDKATVTGIKNAPNGEITYPWSLASGCVIHCTDGDITI